VKKALFKIAFICIGLTIIGLMLTGQAYAQVSLRSAVAIWLFDEGSGNEIRDATGNGNNGGDCPTAELANISERA